MLQNYIKLLLRNARRHTLYTGLNLMSLTIGMASCIVIYLFIQDESKFDSLHENGQNIYRLNELQQLSNGSFQKVALTGSPFGPTLQAEFPEIKSSTRVEEAGKKPLKRGDTQLFLDKGLLYVDSTFLEIFDFKLLHGDRATLLDIPNSIALTQSACRKFFKDENDAIGKQITLGDEQVDYVVTGILEDTPEQSHIQFDALISLVSYTRTHPEYNTDWTGNSLFTYFLLYPNSNYKQLEAKLPEWLVRWTEVKDINKSFGLYFQPLSQIHLESTDVEHDYQNHRKFNGRYLSIFALIGVFILLIASINFMNLTTARSSYRWKEIGIRKSIGARKKQLLMQFIFESVLLAFFALFVAIILDFLLLPMLNQWLGRQLHLGNLLRDNLHILMIVGSTLILGVFASLYPSLYMSSVGLIKALKGKPGNKGNSVFQSTLVVVQFSLAIGLIIGTLIVTQQLTFMRNENLGFNKDQIILISMNKEANHKFDVLKNELLNNEFIQGVTASGQRMGNNFHQTTFNIKSDKGLRSGFSSYLNVEYDYLGVYGISLVEGRTFSKDFKADQGKAFIVNKAMAKEFELGNPIGTLAGYEGDSLGNIIGVVDDFKYNSLHHKVSSLSIVCQPAWGYDEMSIKIRGQNVNEAIGSIRNIWQKTISTFPFEYSFLDDHFENLYKNDQQLSSAVSIMTVLAILISGMGLFGLAALITIGRTKEIGIRKVLGASEVQIWALLSQNFVLLIMISFIIIVPVSYYLLSAWLQNFAYHIRINPLIFGLSGVIAFAIGLLTISYHTVRTARINPVDSLKNE